MYIFAYLTFTYGHFSTGDFTSADFAEPLLSLDLEAKLWLLNVDPAVRKGMRRPFVDTLVETLQSVLPHYYPSSADHEETISASSFADCRFEIGYKVHESEASADLRFLEKYQELILGQFVDDSGRYIVSTATLTEFLAREAPQALRSTLLSLPMILVLGGEGGKMKLPPHIIVTDDDAYSLREGRLPLGGLKCSKGLATKLAFYDDSALSCAKLVKDSNLIESNIYMHDLSYFTRLIRIITSGIEAFASAGRLERRVGVGSDRVLIPILMFKWKDRMNEGARGLGYHDYDMTVDTAALNDWARSLVLPHQEAVVLAESHYVEDYPQVLVALRNAEREHVYSSLRNGSYGGGASHGMASTNGTSVHVPYLDSKALFSDLFGSHIDKPCLTDEGDLQAGSRGGVGTVLLGRLLGRGGFGEAAVVEAAIRDALSTPSDTKSSDYSTTSRLNDALSDWLSMNHDTTPHDMDVEGPDVSGAGEADQRHGYSNKVTIVPVLLFSGLHTTVSTSSTHQTLSEAPTGARIMPLLDGHSEIAVLDWKSGEVSEDHRGMNNQGRSSSGGVVLGVHGPYDQHLRCYTPATSSWSDCAKSHDVSDATKVVARGIATALTALKSPYMQSRAYRHFNGHHNHEVQERGNTGVAERFWEGGLHPYGPLGVFPSETALKVSDGKVGVHAIQPHAYSSDNLDKSKLLVAWAAKRSILMSRAHEVVYSAASTLHHSRGFVQRLIMSMHLFSTGIVASRKNRAHSDDNVRERAMDISDKTFLDHADILSLEESGPDSETSRSNLVHYFGEENTKRLKLKAGLTKEENIHSISRSATEHGVKGNERLTDLVATGQALKYLARHVASHEAQIHYLQEKLDYTIKTLSSSSTSAALEEGGESTDLLLDLTDTINHLAASFSEGVSTLHMMESAMQSSLNACEVHWDVMDDAAVYANIKSKMHEDKKWFENTRARSRGAGIGANNSKPNSGLRGLLMYLFGISEKRRDYIPRNLHPSSKEAVENILKASAGGAAAIEDRGWFKSTLLVLIAIAALISGVVALWWVLQRFQNNKVKKMA